MITEASARSQSPEGDLRMWKRQILGFTRTMMNGNERAVNEMIQLAKRQGNAWATEQLKRIGMENFSHAGEMLSILDEIAPDESGSEARDLTFKRLRHDIAVVKEL